MRKIKDFFEKYSYDSVRMILDQVVLAFFGFGLTMATLHAGNELIMLFAGIGSVIFYLAMLYIVAWKMGTTDRPMIEAGNLPFKPFTGTLVSLVANIPNLLVAVAFMINSLVSNGSGISGVLGRFMNAMYLGLMTLIKFNGSELHMCLECELCGKGNAGGFDYLHAYWWMYFIIIIPSLLISTVAYIMGAKGKMFAKLMVPDLPASDRPTKKEIKENKEKQKKQ